MSKKLDRREVVLLGGAAIGLATVMPRRLFGRAPATWSFKLILLRHSSTSRGKERRDFMRGPWLSDS